VDTAPASAALPVDKIRTTSGWKALDFAGVWRYRDVLLAIAGRDVKLRYKQTFLGVAWVLLQPLLAAGIFSFVFGLIAKMPSDGKSYFLFSYCGLLGWNLFSNTITRTSTSLISNAAMVSKIYFPRLILPFSTVPSTLIDFARVACDVRGATGDLSLADWSSRIAVSGVADPPADALVRRGTVVQRAVGQLSRCAVHPSGRDAVSAVRQPCRLLGVESPAAVAGLSGPKSSLESARSDPLVAAGHPAAGLAVRRLLHVVCILTLITGAFIFKRMERQFADVI